MKRLAPVLCVLVLIAVKLYGSRSRDEPNRVAELHRRTTATATMATTATTTPPDDPPAPAGLVPAPSTPALRRLADAAARARVMDAITAARARRVAATPNLPAAASPGFADDALPMSMTDVKASFKAVVPLLADCYDRALPHLAVKSGDIAVHLRATGEPDVGTLIDDATLDGGGGLLDDQELGECLHETLLSVELPPMPEGGVVEITYPISFQESGD